MMENDIIDPVVGMELGVRSGENNRYGRVTSVTQTTIIVRMSDGDKEELRFSRATRFVHGSKESRYLRPYYLSANRARALREDYESRTAAAKAALQAKGVL